MVKRLTAFAIVSKLGSIAGGSNGVYTFPLAVYFLRSEANLVCSKDKGERVVRVRIAEDR
jgi:hypothetical protein